MLVWSVLGRLTVHACFVPITFTMFNKTLAIWVSQTCSSQLVQQSLCHVLPCLCDHACKRPLAIFCKSRAFCPNGRLLSVPIYPACAEQGHQYDRNKIHCTENIYQTCSEMPAVPERNCLCFSSHCGMQWADFVTLQWKVQFSNCHYLLLHSILQYRVSLKTHHALKEKDF